MLSIRKLLHSGRKIADQGTSNARGTRLLPWKRGCRPLSTYYDSQSGMHVPVHDENVISGYLSGPAMDYTPEKLAPLVASRSGLGGLVCLPQGQDPADLLSSLDAIAWPQDFTVFLPSTALQQQQQGNNNLQLNSMKPNKNVAILFEYGSEASDTSSCSVAEDIAACVQNSITTALVCRDDGDAMIMASGVAQTLDDTGGGDYVFVVGERGKHGNDILELCEELSYLDVPGPTMKSRLVVDISNNTNEECEEAVEECLLLGVNKFAIDEDRLNWLGHFVQAQGKSCTFQFD